MGGKLSLADVLLLECTLMLEEKFPDILKDFPNVKVNVFQQKNKSTTSSMRKPKPSAVKRSSFCYSFQFFQGRMTQIPAISRFLQPGSKRKPPPDEKYLKNVVEVLNLKLPL